MKITVSTIALTAYATAIQLTGPQGNDAARFTAWANEHNKHYDSVQEHQARLGEWLRKDAEYKSINANPDNTFTVGHNNMSDWTDTEFRAILRSTPTVLPDAISDAPENSLAEVFGEST